MYLYHRLRNYITVLFVIHVVDKNSFELYILCSKTILGYSNK